MAVSGGEKDLDAVVGAVLGRVVLPDPGRVLRGDGLGTVRELVVPAARDRGELDRRVPGCPDWALRDLGFHLGRVQQFQGVGDLVGVVSLDLNEVGRYTLGIPTEVFFTHREELLRYGKRVSRPPRAWIGFYCYMLREHVVIAGVLPGTPGERGGLRAGDVVLSVDDVAIGLRCDLYNRLWEHKPGEVIRFHVFRDYAVVEVSVEGADVEQFFA
jgi:hypothetical protein